ncbi:WASH complex subunit 5 isoform X2 [Neocloeon triangulifer]|uniref:WASH complex subunit 5 isoform X2 n=1 Tax=Neocloeon triangulifer TaxID=2078957 RepID=UPI00286F9D5A|nr:WASH complex subunit 5 isoform X2 [Neocloeon triangulifer]
MTEFLSGNNPCERFVLNLVSRGNYIIAELLRIKETIPAEFKTVPRKKQSQSFSDVIFDFSYFKNSDDIEKKIENNARLQELDAQLREKYTDILQSCYFVLEEIHKFAIDLNQLIADLEGGKFLQQSLESMMTGNESKQLMCEALYLYGVMLIVCETHLPGFIRERLLVSCYRYNAQNAKSSGTSLDDVYKLMRSCNSTVHYHEDLFLRVPLNEDYVEQVLDCLRTDDIYHQVVAYPLPQHRSAALATQAAMLYVCLYFCPSVLHNQVPKMREIVDKYYPDNWVINVYMGLTANLAEAWDPFKAAIAALNNTLDQSNLRDYSGRRHVKLQKILNQSKQMLLEGYLNEEFVLSHVTNVIALLRECNITLRWYMLHSAALNTSAENIKRSKHAQDLMLLESKFSSKDIFQLLLNTSQLELKIKEFFKQLLSEKTQKWLAHRQDSQEKLQELSALFSGTKALPKVIQNESLQTWFAETASTVGSLDIEDQTAKNKIFHLVQALEEVQVFHQLDSTVEVRQCLEDTRNLLKTMLRLSTVKEDWLVALQIIGDFNYAWVNIGSYTNMMQNGIKEDPLLVGKLRAIFIKLSSAMETPLIRINEAGSQYLLPVSQFYSGLLVAYVGRVLHVIPQMTFTLMARIIDLQTNTLVELPTRLDKDALKTFSQLNTRFEVAQLTNSVSEFAEGILTMKSTLMGILRVDPKQIFEEGIRRELVTHVADTLDQLLVFNPKSKGDLITKLEALGKAMDGYQRSLGYMQDYVRMNGVQIWQEEMSKLFAYSLEQECAEINSSLSPKTISPNSVNFIGRLTREIIRVSDPKATFYSEEKDAWCDLKTKAEVLNPKTFQAIYNSIAVWGLSSVDKVLGHMIAAELNFFLHTTYNELLQDRTNLELFGKISKTLYSSELIVNPTSAYPQLAARLLKTLPTLTESALKIGQMQMIKKGIVRQLRISSQYSARHLTSVLKSFNNCLLTEIKAHFNDPKSAVHPKENGDLLPELTTYLEWVGESEPSLKIYHASRSIPYLSLLMFLLCISQITKINFPKNGDTLLVSAGLDGHILTLGVHTILHHFHSNVHDQFTTYFSQAVNSYFSANLQNNLKTGSVPFEITNCITFLDKICALNGTIPKTAISDAILSQP